MIALLFDGPGQVSYREIPRPELKDGWTLIRVSHAGVCGSDMTIFAGKHPRAKAPLVMGHEFSGYIASPHPEYTMGTLVTVFPYISCGNCERCQNGQFHVCSHLKLIGIDLDGGMAEYVQAPNELIYPVPENVSPQLAAFIEPVGISVHVARAGGYRPGDSVAVFGAGSIGLSTALTLREFGAQNLMICEPNPTRAALARTLGFDVLDPEDPVGQIYARTNGCGAEFVYDCAGVQPVIDVLPDAVKINGRIVVVAGYKDKPRIDFQKGMFREFNIQFVRNCTKEDFSIAIKLISKDIGHERLLNYVIPLSEGEKGFNPPREAYKVLFQVEDKK